MDDMKGFPIGIAMKVAGAISRGETPDPADVAVVDLWRDKQQHLSSKGKKAVTSDEAFKIQERWGDQPHGWVQWKGTDVCMDVYCKCGYHSHIDAEFAYNVKCPKCGTVYSVNGHVEFIELEHEPAQCVVMDENPVDDSTWK